MKIMISGKNLVIGLIILLLGAFVSPTVAQGTTIYVDYDNTSGPWDGTLLHPYQFIQDGIDSASAGDTVYVFNGTYYEWVNVNKAINLTGENKDSTVIDAAGYYYVDIASTRVNLSGFTVQNSSPYGVYVRRDSNTIVNNIVKSGSHSMIYLFFASYCTVSGNTVGREGYFAAGGIRARYGSNNTITGNFVYDCDQGIPLEYDVSNTLISGNTVVNCFRAVYLNAAYNDTVTDNTFTFGGIDINGSELAHWNTHTIEDNYVNGEPIYYYKNNSDTVTVPSDAAQVILANCSNFTIQNLNLSGVYSAIQLGFSSGNNIIGDTVTENVGYGHGIELNNSSNNYIARNSITNNENHGIYVQLSSDSNIISENTIADNEIGIRMTSEPPLCKGNMIYHNNLVNNSDNATAYDREAGANIWDDGYPSGGNYWSDFDEPGEGAYDNNGDGIVDSAYNISGIYNRDRYPLMQPWDETPSTPPCGDVTGDGNTNSADIVRLINYLFVGGPQPWPALCIGDINSDGYVNSADVSYFINYLFIGGPAPSTDCCAP